MIKEDSDNIHILEKNWNPILIPPPYIRIVKIVEIVEQASQVSHQCCIC